jgi:hypothetical protein
MSRRRRGGTVLLLVLVAATAGLYGVSRGVIRLPKPSSAGTPSSSSTAARPTADATAVPSSGAGTFTYAGGDGAVIGTSGPLLRYQVGVEDGLGINVDQFATAVETILSDPRSWIAGGTLRFERVSGAAGQEFAVLLASPVLSEALCAEDGLDTVQYTNCRLSDGRVVINSARWLTGVEGYGAPLSVYRAYALNHEVGHQLGYGHEQCPAPGQPAPVMQQQTLGLHGCQPYGWPYRDGVRYVGPPAAA